MELLPPQSVDRLGRIAGTCKVHDDHTGKDQVDLSRKIIIIPMTLCQHHNFSRSRPVSGRASFGAGSAVRGVSQASGKMGWRKREGGLQDDKRCGILPTD